MRSSDYNRYKAYARTAEGREEIASVMAAAHVFSDNIVLPTGEIAFRGTSAALTRKTHSKEPNIWVIEEEKGFGEVSLAGPNPERTEERIRRTLAERHIAKRFITNNPA